MYGRRDGVGDGMVTRLEKKVGQCILHARRRAHKSVMADHNQERCTPGNARLIPHHQVGLQLLYLRGKASCRNQGRQRCVASIGVCVTSSRFKVAQTGWNLYCTVTTIRLFLCRTPVQSQVPLSQCHPLPTRRHWHHHTVQDGAAAGSSEIGTKLRAAADPSLEVHFHVVVFVSIVVTVVFARCTVRPSAPSAAQSQCAARTAVPAATWVHRSLRHCVVFQAVGGGFLGAVQ